MGIDLYRHLSPDEVGEFALRGRLGGGRERHVDSCPECRRSLVRSLLVERVMRTSPQDKPFGPHLSARDLDDFHAAAFELDDEGAGRFASAFLHLTRCDSCFARLFALHEKLTPSLSARRSAVEALSTARSTRILGRLTIRGAFRWFWQPDSGTSPGDFDKPVPPPELASAPTEEMSLGTMDYAALANRVRERSEPSSPAPAVIHVDELLIRVWSAWSAGQCQLEIEVVDTASRKPFPHISFAPVYAGGSVGQGVITDEAGKARLLLEPPPVALRLGTTSPERSWQVDLDLSP